MQCPICKMLCQYETYAYTVHVVWQETLLCSQQFLLLLLLSYTFSQSWCINIITVTHLVTSKQRCRLAV
jgi:hypothetical protein